MQPIYTTEVCKPAYQLRWSLALFPDKILPSGDNWLSQLTALTEPDGIRVLGTYQNEKRCLFLLLSTKTHVKPSSIVRAVKGRVVAILRETQSNWRRNFRLTSIGNANADTVEDYVAKQLFHHREKYTTSQIATLMNYQWSDPRVDLNAPVFSSHSQYVLAMHVALVHAERFPIAAPSFIEKTQKAILATAAKKGHSISRIGLLTEHVHFTLKFDYETSPQDVALAYMNNISYCHGMIRLWMDSFYVGTIGPYDMDAVRRRMAGGESASHRLEVGGDAGLDSLDCS